jgi:hypothetical protein
LHFDRNTDAIRQDAALLHGFIEPLRRMCSELRDDYPVFTEPSRKFFAYISNLGSRSQQYLEAFPAFYDKSVDGRSANSKRQKLFTLKTSWEALHSYIQPALDADSLHLPMPLITALTDIVNSVSEWKDYKFVLFHTAEANYLQIPSGMARRAANDVAESVGSEQFDSNLGLVGIPYSQSASFFLNSLLPHEFAHFIYQEHSSGDIGDQIESSLDKVLGKEVALTSEELSWCVRELSCWVEETFCDLLAICMIGPAFSLALIQLIGGTGLVGMNDGEPADFYAFRDAYPADAARLHFHRLLLGKLGWWPIVGRWKSSSIKAIEKCEPWSDLITIEGQLPEGVTVGQLLDCYRGVCHWMMDYCVEYFPRVSAQVDKYVEQSPVISEYLARAIVPSTVVIGHEQHHPEPIILLNAGFHFLLEELPQLINRISGEDPLSVEAQSRIGSRVELWILKAIEDNRLLTRQVI